MAQDANQQIQTDPRKPRFLDYPYRVSGDGTPNTIAPAEHLTGAPVAYTADDHLRDLIPPDFGVGVQRLVFEPNGDALRATVQFLISNNLQRWLGDRIRVDQVTVTSDPGFEETITIEIVYTVRTTQERQRVQVQV